MIGEPIDRRDAAQKVTGAAHYSYERPEAAGAAYGVLVGSAIAKGRLIDLRTTEAERSSGVLLVLTHRNAPAQGRLDMAVGSQFQRARPILVGPRIVCFGQPIALVVAATFEQARDAAAKIVPVYAPAKGAYALSDGRAYAPAMANGGFAADTKKGDFDRAFGRAAARLDRRYSTPMHFAQPMEPHACCAAWQGDELSIWGSVQAVARTRAALAATLLLLPQKIHIDAAFVGGGFGSKLLPHAELIGAALAARVLDRPVKIQLSRRQMFSMVGGRPETSQRVRLGARPDGRLTSIAHEVVMQSTVQEEFVEQTATVTRSLYRGAHRLTTHRVVPLDRPLGEAVRGPGEVPGLLAVETAMDELADRLRLDPVELRLRNDTATDPESGVPLSSRRLADCLRDGARRFGWSNRPVRPATRRDGSRLVGYGMASAIRFHFQGASRASVRVTADGRVEVRSDLTDIGTGSYTVLAQVAAAALQVPLQAISVQLARTDLPEGAGSGGSQGAPNTSAALYRACDALRAKVATAAAAGDGRVPSDIRDAVARHFPQGVEAEGAIVGQADDPLAKQYSRQTYGAVFAEVGVDADTFEIRVRRMLGVFAAGRILNAKMARSQLIGGMVWGMGSALFEAAHVDPRSGHVVNGDLAEYLVAVHADVPAIEAVLLDDFDDKANPIGVKGVGELGICGSGAAVANAVFNATGRRVRDFPITLDKLLSADRGRA